MKQNMNLLKSFAVVSTITFCSRVLGFVRDTIVARMFGVGFETDAFFVAFKLPNLLRRIFAEGAFSQAFVPILTEYKNQKSENDTRLLIAWISGLLTLVLAVVTLIGILTAPWIILITAPGFTKSYDKFVLTYSLLRITFPYIFLISLTSMVGAILNTWNLYSVPAFAPTFLNISMIISSLFAAPYFNPPILALAWSIIIGGILQFFYQLPFLKKIGMLVLPRINIYDIGIWRILKQMVPAIIGVSAGQISMIVNTMFTSFLVSGSVSWMYYADRLMEFPSGVLGVALCTILLPSLTKSISNKKYSEYSILMDRGLRLCLILSAPSAVILGCLSQPLTIVLFQYNKFTAFDVMMTHKILVSYSMGLIGLITVKVLATGFYSLHDMKTPVKTAIITLLLTQLFNLICIGPLKHVGLSLSISLSASCNAFMLYFQLRKKKLYIPQPGWVGFVIKITIAILVMIMVLMSIIAIMPEWQIGTMFSRLFRLSILISIGTIIYLTILLLLGFRLRDFSYHTLQ